MRTIWLHLAILQCYFYKKVCQIVPLLKLPLLIHVLKYILSLYQIKKLNGTITNNVSPFCLACKQSKSSSFSLLPQGMFQNDNESYKKFGLKNVDSSLLFFALLLTFMWLMRLICVGSSETGPISCLVG